MCGRLHHVELYVPDLSQCIEFWGWFLGKLGYTEYQRWDTGISYILDSTYIVFVQTEERFLNKPCHRCNSGLNHLAFHADSKEFVDDITEDLRNRGVHILYDDRHPHAGGEESYGVFFEDPMRMKVELTL